MAQGAGELLQFLSQPPLRPAERTQPLHLSFAQQRLWVLDRLEPGSVAYNKPIALYLQGPLQRACRPPSE